jgi:hypothetical protein
VGERGFFERRGREGFAESAKEDREKRKPKIQISSNKFKAGFMF